MSDAATVSDRKTPGKKVLVDCRVFSTAAVDRGMGVYVDHIIAILDEAGFDVTVLLFRNCRLAKESWIVERHGVRFADYRAAEFVPDPTSRIEELHGFTAFLSALLEDEHFDLYVDGTPFIGPQRLDVFSCPVVAVFYDFIPLRHPSFYLGAESVRCVYQNGLARLAKADAIICISDTVRAELSRYLGIPDKRLFTIYPRIGAGYERPTTVADTNFDRSFLFSILGGHKSKNPDRSLSIFAELSELSEIDLRLNAPTPDQKAYIEARLPNRPNVFLSHSIVEEHKHSLQANAICVAHLSLEEGFGIPLLEAIFLGRKLLALDIPVNREIMGAGWDHRAGAVLLLPPTAASLLSDEFRHFLCQPADAEFYRAIKAYFRAAWADAPARMADIAGRARSHFEAWTEELKAAIFTSLPGSNCGVADYSLGYMRSAPFEFMAFCSGENQEFLTPLANVRVGTHLDFERFRARYPSVTCLFNFAFSDELFAGIELMRRHATASDVVLIHERRYFDGLVHIMARNGRSSELLFDYSRNEDETHRKQLAVRCTFDPNFNQTAPHLLLASPISSGWLKDLPARFISHLSPAVLHQMQTLDAWQPGEVVNDLADMEDEIEFIPMGIDDRSTPGVARAARKLRIGRGIDPGDVVVGHFGLILNDIKRLWDVARAVVAFATERERGGRDNRQLFFALVGKIVDATLFQNITELFATVGLSDRLIHSNPALEIDFDTEMAGCDGMFCFRTQQRGHMSHALVRALSLGVPTFVNVRSGFAYDPRTTIDDGDHEGGIKAALEQLFDPETSLDMRRSARRAYENAHRGQDSLRAMINRIGHE